MHVIGLGKAGCNIAKIFSKFPQYHTIGIDTDEDSDIKINEEADHEAYERSFPVIERLTEITASTVTVIVCGAGRISGGILRLLEQLKGNKVSIQYIQPDLALLSEVQKQQEKIVRNILQEYARSGLIEQIILIDNLEVEKGLGGIPITEFYTVLNQAIVNTLHMINVFRNSEAIIGNFVNPSELSRVATVGILDIEKGEEKWFFPLTNPRDMVYYYGINKETLRTDGTLFKKITDYVKSRLKENINISYGVFETNYDQKYCYCMKYSSMVQSFIGT